MFINTWKDKLKSALAKTKKGLMTDVRDLFSLRKSIDDSFWQELEEILIVSDFGPRASEKIIKDLKTKKTNQTDLLIQALKKEMIDVLNEKKLPVNLNPRGLSVILVVGVNGAGKTTSIAKLAYYFKNQNKKVILAAADTFRAAADHQLEIWANRLNVDVVKHQEGSDPAAVVFDALQAGLSRKADVLIVDTAGRIQTKVNLMEELKKIKRVISKQIESASCEVLLVLDANTGQNAISQARLFQEAVDVNGIVLAKLDGTAKGGIIFSIVGELNIPVKFIGTGEKLEDLQEFQPEVFVEALFE